MRKKSKVKEWRSASDSLISKHFSKDFRSAEIHNKRENLNDYILIFRGIFNFIPTQYIQKTKFKNNFIRLMALEEDHFAISIYDMVESMIRIEFDNEIWKKMILVIIPES